MRPSSLLPRGTINPGIENLSFDVNVAIMGYATEAEAIKKAEHPPGQVSNRSEAISVIERARADVIEMEEEREKRKGKR